MRERLVWGDWARILGLYLVILGHFFPGMVKSFIFSFHVPFFFFISGYFTTYKSNNFWKHLTQTLIVPYLLICMINAYIGVGNTNSMIPTFANILLGFHGLDNLIFGGGGCQEMWFVYTLILIKITDHYIYKIRYQIVISIISIIFVYMLNEKEFNIAWSVTDFFICFPFFVMGKWLKLSNNLNNDCKLNAFFTRILSKGSVSCGIIILLLIFQYVISYINGVATVVIADYGKNIILFYILGCTGSFMVILISKYKTIFKSWNRVRILSMGSILVLGFHMHFVRLFNSVIFKELNIPSDYGCYIASAIILLLFIPITSFVMKCVPFLIGKKYEKI